jgi:hypothetical protein
MLKTTGLELRLRLLVSWKHSEHDLLAPGFEYSFVNTYQDWRAHYILQEKYFSHICLLNSATLGLNFKT